MTRKEMRKQQKKNRVVNNTSSSDEISKIIKIISAIAVCFAIIYFATSYITGRMNGNEETGEVEIQKEEILIGETFEKTDKEYMVVYYNYKEDINADLYAMLIQNYNNKKKDIPIYKVDLSSNLSKDYLALENEKSNTKPTSLSNLKINGATVIRIKDKKVVKYVEGKDNIKTYFDGLTK